MKKTWLVYLGVAFAVLLPLLPTGYILTLDMVFVPHMPFPAELSNTYLLDVALWAATQAIPGDVVQRMVLFAVLVGSGVGAHMLVKNQLPAQNWAAYFAGIFYMINPFVYSRFMAGQWLVLLGYALLPFFVRALVRLITQPNRKTALLAGAWLGTIGLVSVHMFGTALVIGGIGTGVAVWQSRRAVPSIKKVLVWGTMCAGVALVINSFWLIPSLLGHTSIAQAAANFNDSQFAAFATNAHGLLGAVGNVLMLQGFWLEPLAMFTLPQQFVPGWGIFIVALWALLAVGIRAGLKTSPLITKIAIGLVIAGLVLAATPLIDWLRHGVPFIAGYREPHKFTALVALGFAVLGGMGASHIVQTVQRKWGSRAARYAGGSLLLLPFVMTPVMLWGFWGQLKPSEYPADWHAMNEVLNAKTKDGAVVFLPWHQYMVFGFAGRIIATPADKFFDRPIIVSDDPELGDAPPTLPNNYKQKIQAVLLAPDAPKQLAALNIRYVLVATEYDFDLYSAIRTHADMQLISTNDSLELYKNNAPKE